MNWWDDVGVPMHGDYRLGGNRCPDCLVPPGAPHLDSCDYAGADRADDADEDYPDDDSGD